MKQLFDRIMKWFWPVAVLGGAYAIAIAIRQAGPEIEVVTPEPQPLGRARDHGRSRNACA